MADDLPVVPANQARVVVAAIELGLIDRGSCDDPELAEGLTLTAPVLAAQVRDYQSGTVVAMRLTGDALEHPDVRAVPAAEARALRDLLNLATARGLL